MSKRVIILGVTGSIGGNAVDVVLSHPGEFQVAAVSALRRREECEAAAKRLGAKAYVGEDAALRAVEENNADVVEVVRCGQCCNADIRCEGLYCFCTLHEEYRTLDYFCASGGQKDEEDIEIANINL